MCMRYDHHLKPAMTALAAVIALSTPAIAQEVPTPPQPSPTVAAMPDATAPVQITPPIRPIIIENTATDGTAADDTAAANDMPVEAAPAAKAPAQRPSAKTSGEAPRDITRAITAPATGAHAVAESTAPATAPASGPIQALSPAPSAAARVEMIDNAQTPTTADWLVPGAVALGVTALAGGAFLLGRRRKTDEPEEEADAAGHTPRMSGTTPATAASNAFAKQEARAPIPTAAAPTEGFDMSRYGRHVQAAYRGPTSDNPSLSLSRRLKRARFFDQRERAAGGKFGQSATQEQPGYVRPIPARTTLEPVG